MDLGVQLECPELEWSEPSKKTDAAYQSWKQPGYEHESTDEGAAPPVEPLSNPLPGPLPLSQPLSQPLSRAPPVQAR